MSAMPPAKLGSEKANSVINRVDGPKPRRLAVTEFRNQFDEKPTEGRRARYERPG
jgi:hypothetical protein